MTVPAGQIALSTRGVQKRFGSLVVANDVNLSLPKGARYALIGPNGAGKTTLINLMTGMLIPDDGQIALGGEDITHHEIAHFRKEDGNWYFVDGLEGVTPVLRNDNVRQYLRLDLRLGWKPLDWLELARPPMSAMRFAVSFIMPSPGSGMRR